ncbi:MAG: PD-(D/E)XK nuclease family protein [Archangium sp.]
MPQSGSALLVGASFDAVAELSRSLKVSIFGWRRTTLYRCALELVRPVLLERELTPVSSLSLEALWARVAYELGEEKLLHRLEPLEGRPGLARALSRTVGELRMLNVRSGVEPALLEACEAFETLLDEKRLIDRAGVYALALERLNTLPSSPVLLLDVATAPGRELSFATALARAAPSALITAPAEETQLIASISASLGIEAEVLEPTGEDALSRLQRNLFTAQHVADAEVTLPFFSAPGEARECVEIARRVISRAREGSPFDEMAVLLRSPGSYRGPLEDAFRRAGIDAWFSAGQPRPDPAGRALLALLACAAEGLSARRFAEYLSLSQVPTPDAAGAPPAANTESFVAPDGADTLLPPSPPVAAPPEEEVGDPDAPAVLGQLRAPWRWEDLIIEAAVIGGTDRWRRRLSGLRAAAMKAQQNPTATEAQRGREQRRLLELTSLEQFALPLLDELVALPKRAPWRDWREALQRLATRALKFPTRVLAVLNELAQMDPVGPLELSEVRTVLSRRLSEMTDPPEGRRHGQIFVGTVESARGLSFDTVFIPGLAERVFPQKIREDPLFSDRVRRDVHEDLEVAANRVSSERHALQLAVGAARARAVLSYPRVDAEHARPRVPSFYALEAARAVQGRLPGFEALQRQAESSSRVRLAWPAPDVPAQAIDETEFDLSVLDGILHSRNPVKGRGRYLVLTNRHLARALRARFSRWQNSAWTPNDGFVKPGASGRTALEAHQPAARLFSPTSLEQFSACPYKFYLSTIARLSPFEIPGELEELGPLEKGSMAHDVQFKLLSALRADGIEVTPQTLTQVQLRLHEVVKAVAAEVYDEFKPAIERVWVDGVHTLEADLREWLKRVAEDAEWKPAYFELSFGLPGRDVEKQDERSSPEPVTVTEGLRVRGSIDLVERGPHGALRACDYKTGRARAEEGNVIGGGRHLQPLLYALVLEKLFPDASISGGRLFYTTQVGGYRSVLTRLDAPNREAFGRVARVIRGALETGFFPAAPDKDECRYCDFKAVCGPDEERRIRRTRKGVRSELKELVALRDEP